MNYDDVTASFANYVDTGVQPAPTITASPARRLRDAIEPIAMHSVWSRSVNERQAELGLDFFSGYLWGRASALGEPDPAVVSSAFAVFDPMLLTPVYENARQTVGRTELIKVRSAATIASLSAVFEAADVPADAISEVADALQVAAQTADGTGRPLFSGFANQAWPTESIGRMWHACEMLREHRGDSHVAVFVAHGMSPIEMNLLTELWVGMPLFSYSSTRGWSLEALAESATSLRSAGLLGEADLTDDGRALRARIEDDTDAIQQPIIETLGSQLDQLLEQLTDWSQLCVDAGAFPPDPCKRAAG